MRGRDEQQVRKGFGQGETNRGRKTERMEGRVGKMGCGRSEGEGSKVVIVTSFFVAVLLEFK